MACPPEHHTLEPDCNAQAVPVVLGDTVGARTRTSVTLVRNPVVAEMLKLFVTVEIVPLVLIPNAPETLDPQHRIEFETRIQQPLPPQLSALALPVKVTSSK